MNQKAGRRVAITKTFRQNASIRAGISYVNVICRIMMDVVDKKNAPDRAKR
jgi:hypothetical protein